MRRALLIFLMWLVPFQAVWSAGHALHEHVDSSVVHSHGDAHGHDYEEGDGSFFDVMNDTLGTHDDDGRHGSHGHAAFSFMVADIEFGLSDIRAADPPSGPFASFTSHIPLLPDPPPAVRI